MLVLEEDEEPLLRGRLHRSNVGAELDPPEQEVELAAVQLLEVPLEIEGPGGGTAGYLGQLLHRAVGLQELVKPRVADGAAGSEAKKVPVPGCEDTGAPPPTPKKRRRRKGVVRFTKGRAMGEKHAVRFAR